MFMTFKFSELEIGLPNTTSQFAFSSNLQFAARKSILMYKTCTEFGQEHSLVNLHTMLSPLTLIVITSGKNA